MSDEQQVMSGRSCRATDDAIRSCPHERLGSDPAADRPPTVRRLRGMPIEGEYEPSSWDWVSKQVDQIESSGGTKGLTLQGKPVVVVTMRGRRSGKVRKAALDEGRARRRATRSSPRRAATPSTPAGTTTSSPTPT